MKDKQGEHLDHRIRQALSTLPDAPVKETSFDAAALWEQLRPELAVQPVLPQRSAQHGWWWLAASLVGTLLGGWWWAAQLKQTGIVPASPMSIALHQTPQRTSLAKVDPSTGIHVERTAKQQWPGGQRVDKQRRLTESKAVQRTPAPPVEQPMSQPVQGELSDVPVLVAVPDLPQAATATTPPVAASTVRTPLKRRFVVVHQNDLRAEADIRAKLERNDRFVRMGGAPSGATLSGTSSASTDARPGLVIPLN